MMQERRAIADAITICSFIQQIAAFQKPSVRACCAGNKTWPVAQEGRYSFIFLIPIAHQVNLIATKVWIILYEVNR
jgi:hypothetical protein